MTSYASGTKRSCGPKSVSALSVSAAALVGALCMRVYHEEDCMCNVAMLCETPCETDISQWISHRDAIMIARVSRWFLFLLVRHPVSVRSTFAQRSLNGDHGNVA